MENNFENYEKIYEKTKSAYQALKSHYEEAESLIEYNQNPNIYIPLIKKTIKSVECRSKTLNLAYNNIIENFSNLDAFTKQITSKKLITKTYHTLNSKICTLLNNSKKLLEEYNSAITLN